MNVVNLTGRLTRDPETRNGVTHYTLAVDRFKKGEADFIRCVAFDKTAEFANKYFSKGKRVGITGRLRQDMYEDRNGARRETVEVIVERQEFLDSKKLEEAPDVPGEIEVPFV